MTGLPVRATMGFYDRVPFKRVLWGCIKVIPPKRTMATIGFYDKAPLEGFYKQEQGPLKGTLKGL